MAIDLEADRLISFAEAAELLPGRPHVSTIWRWASRGVKGVQLESIAIGSRRFTSIEAVQDFINGTSSRSTLGGSSRALGDRRDQNAAKVERELDAEGI